MAQSHLHDYADADSQFQLAGKLCSEVDSVACGDLLRARGSEAIERNDLDNASSLFTQSLSSARRFSQRMDEATALMNLGYVRLLEERFDDAIDWSHAAEQIAHQLDAGDILLNTMGNLGWAYYKLGDAEKALKLFKTAGERAEAVGDVDDAITWLTTAGFVYQDSNEPARAADSYRRALSLAQQVDSKEGVINSLVSLAHVTVDTGRADEADRYVNQVTPLIRANGNRLDELYVIWAQAKIAAALHRDQEAERLFRAVERDPASQFSMRFGAEHQLALLFESEGDLKDAESMYRTALATFEGARDRLKVEDSKLPFLANATGIYNDYIHFLIGQGKGDDALLVADQSRARTLAQGLGETAKPEPGQVVVQTASFTPQGVARKARATLLFYWLGEKQSYLWAITPQEAALFTLPAKAEITPLIERYNKELQGPDDPLESGNVSNATGRALYAMLVAPAAGMIRNNIPVMILADGALSALNFETLLTTGPEPHSSEAHYWIEDVILSDAPSLAMLASAKPQIGASGRLLLLGDAVSPNEDYPQLPQAALEMKQIEKHFPAGEVVVYAGQQATPEAYLSSDPRQFSFIHFVSHGVASHTDPLDSAIILSRPASSLTEVDGGFKLYAREVMQHPIDARLVTISACYGSGTRAYAGEGLVGLSWAFLRAGAHNAIGALWGASDESTPRLMDSLYQGLQNGQSPNVALRTAKLALLQSHNNFRKPFYWAPFQLYTRM